MGWASASGLVEDITNAFIEYEETKDRKAFFAAVVKTFEDGDWDTQDEVMGIDDDLDAVIKELHPDWYNDDDEEEEDEDE
jgi:hypothetical protein